MGHGRIVGWSLLGIVGLVAGCADDPASDYPYEADQTRVIGAGTLGAGGGVTNPDPSGVPQTAVYATPDSDECINLDDVCLRPQDECGNGGTADVIVGEAGEVLSVICYPNKNYEILELDTDPIEDPTLGNRQVIVIDGLDDGDDVVGDLTIEGNNVIVYGDGPDTSVIGGNLDIQKNNAIVRGVRIKGDVTISKNNASLVYCVIEGDLTITGNNVNLALCDVFGEVSIQGNNAVFVSNRVSGEQPIDGVNLMCNDNFRFVDENEDALVQAEELTDPVTCQSRGSDVADTSRTP